MLLSEIGKISTISDNFRHTDSR